MHAIADLPPLPPQLDMKLDAGIEQAVLLLHQHGIETFESCEGGEGHPFPEPTVRFHGGPGEGAHAYSIAASYALPVQEIRRCWDVIDGELTGPHWEIVFSRKVAGTYLEAQKH